MKTYNNLGGKLLGPTIDMISQAEAKISEMGMDKEILEKLVDRLAEKALRNMLNWLTG